MEPPRGGDAPAPVPPLEASLAYWRQQLCADVLPALELPVDLPRPAQLTFRGGTVAFALHPDVAARLAELCRARGFTTYQLMLALWSLLLCRHAGQKEVVVGSAGPIGHGTNVLPLRVQALRGVTVGALLAHVREAVTDGVRHGAALLQRAVRELVPRLVHDGSRNAIFQTMLTWADKEEVQVEGDAHMAGESVSPDPSGDTKCDVSLSVRVAAAGDITGAIEYNRDLFERATVERLAARLSVLAAALADAPAEAE